MRYVILAAAILGLFVSAAAPAQTYSFDTIDNPNDPTFNALLGINDDGTIVGYYGSGAQGHPTQGYKIGPPYTTFVALNQPGAAQTQPTGINNAGAVSGFFSGTNIGPTFGVSQDAYFAFLFEPVGANVASISATNPLTAVPGCKAAVSEALGVNNSDVVVGFYEDAGCESHGYTYTVHSAKYTPIKVKGATQVAATGINDNGQICGFYVNGAGKTLGFVQLAGAVTTFEVPGSTITRLLGINNSGVAVGFYQMSPNDVSHGLYYVPSTGAWSTVDEPNGVSGTVLNGINNNNQLVGFYTDAAGNQHGMIVNVIP